MFSILAERSTLDFGSEVKEASWKERGLFNDKMLSQAVISSATLYLALSQGNSLLSLVIREKMAGEGGITVNNT